MPYLFTPPFDLNSYLLQHLCLLLELIPKFQRYWPGAGKLISIEVGRWRSRRALEGLRTHGYDIVPMSIRGELIQRAHEQWVGEAEAAVTAPALTPAQ